ncbi:MAG TPA: ATP-binding protein [Myxococcales bacterium]|jgi:signal transduction histidine kinase|nr:ATP-binding protein [Myxococcales bacterium]
MKLRPRIALVSCLVALTSVGVTGALLIHQSRAFSQEQLLQRQTLLVQNRAFALGDSLELASRELTRLSHMAEVDLTDNDLRPEATLLAHAHRNSTLFNIGLQIEDATGRCIWSEPASKACPGTSYALEPWFVAGRRAPGPVVMSERAEGEPTVINLVVPIGGRPGAADGVLRGIIDLRTDRIVSPAMTGSLPPETEAALVASGGEIVFPGRLTRSAGWSEALAEAPARNAGAFVIEEGGKDFLYAHAPVAHADWGLVFRWPYGALDVGLHKQLQLLLEILALGGALAVLLGFTSSRFLTRPIEELMLAVRALGAARARGEPGAPGPAEGTQAAARTDELGELARAFADLRGQLAHGDAVHREDLDRIRDLASSLEERVRARTAELEEVQRSLVAQERLAAMGRAAAVISHELKNSLNALGMGFDLVALEADRHPQLSRVNAQVRAEVGRLRNMADELLVFARTPRIDARPVDLNELVQRTIELCAEQAASAGVAVATDLAGKGAPLVVPCDAERIQSALVNLLQNAIEAVAWATPSCVRREVLIATQKPLPAGPGFAAVIVEDSGPGVAAEARERLFEPFFTTKRNGTGLGLATAQRFAAAHGGHIELSASPLGGARFTVRLPVRDARGSAEAA